MVKLGDTPDLGSGAERRGGSRPSSGILTFIGPVAELVDAPDSRSGVEKRKSSSLFGAIL